MKCQNCEEEGPEGVACEECGFVIEKPPFECGDIVLSDPALDKHEKPPRAWRVYECNWCQCTSAWRVTPLWTDQYGNEHHRSSPACCYTKITSDNIPEGARLELGEYATVLLTKGHFDLTRRQCNEVRG